MSRHQCIATHHRLLPAATSYDDAMPTAVALHCRGRRALRQAVLQPAIIYATTAQRPCYIATTGARHGPRRAMVQLATRKLQQWPGRAGTGKLRCCHRLRHAFKTGKLQLHDHGRLVLLQATSGAGTSTAASCNPPAALLRVVWCTTTSGKARC